MVGADHGRGGLTTPSSQQEVVATRGFPGLPHQGSPRGVEARRARRLGAPTRERSDHDHHPPAHRRTGPPQRRPRRSDRRPHTGAAAVTASLVVAPLLYLAADSTYAVRGWDDPTAGLLHVLGAIGYGFVVLCVAHRLPTRSGCGPSSCSPPSWGWRATPPTLRGDPHVVRRRPVRPPGRGGQPHQAAAALLPLSLLLVAAALHRLGTRWQAVGVLVATVLWPVAHIGNLPWLAVPANLLLVLAIGSLGWPGACIRTADGASRGARRVLGFPA